MVAGGADGGVRAVVVCGDGGAGPVNPVAVVQALYPVGFGISDQSPSGSWLCRGDLDHPDRNPDRAGRSDGGGPAGVDGVVGFTVREWFHGRFGCDTVYQSY